MIILGIDPGIAIVGYGLIEYNSQTARITTTIDYGAITTVANTPVPERIEIIYRELDELIKLYHPDVMAVEELFFNTNQKTAIFVAEARGVILLCAKHNNIEIAEYTPLQVKQSVVGYGQAEKSQVIMMVRTFLKLTKAPKLDDTADALAIAICHAHTGASKMRQYFNK